jgi:hypothetical protein
VALLLWEVLKRPGAPITHEGPPAPTERVAPLKTKEPAPPKSMPGDTEVPNDSRLAPPPLPTPSARPTATAPSVPFSTPSSKPRGSSKSSTPSLGSGS